MAKRFRPNNGGQRVGITSYRVILRKRGGYELQSGPVFYREDVARMLAERLGKKWRVKSETVTLEA